VLHKDNAINVDTINEKTAATGVTIDGLLIKDSVIPTSGLSDGGVTVAKMEIGSIMLPCWMSEDDTEVVEVNCTSTWKTHTGVSKFRIFVPSSASRLIASVRLRREGSGSQHVFARFDVGGSNSTAAESLNVGYQWVDDLVLDVGALSGWQDLTWEASAVGTHDCYIQGFAFYWTVPL
jgi:hypothetical protein